MGNIKNTLFNYLTKRYVVINNTFYEHGQSKHIHGHEIISTGYVVFGITFEEMFDVFKTWAYLSGFNGSDEVFKLAYQPKRLEFNFSVELLNDIGNFWSPSDIESQIIETILTELSIEIDTDILNELVTSATTINEFFSILKCVGYEFGPLLYNEVFVPKRSFLSTSYNDMMNERQNNKHWQDWIRAGGHIKET